MTTKQTLLVHQKHYEVLACKLEIEEDLSSLEFNFHYDILGTA